MLSTESENQFYAQISNPDLSVLWILIPKERVSKEVQKFTYDALDYLVALKIK